MFGMAGGRPQSGMKVGGRGRDGVEVEGSLE